jgi:KipI family sensor histidine kinase inhibitor
MAETQGQFTLMPSGDEYIRVVADDDVTPAELAHTAQQLRANTVWTEVVSGMTEIMLRYDALTITYDEAATFLKNDLSDIRPRCPETAETQTIPICYDPVVALDLEMVSKELGISKESLINRHLAAPYQVEMIGFLPGFAYCGGLQPELAVDRLPTPRQRLEAGSVGITGQQTGIYALAGPGGWPIIGRTPMKLVDMTAREPFALQPGMQIQFLRISLDEFQAQVQSS